MNYINKSISIPIQGFMKSVRKISLVLMCMLLVGCVDATRVNVSKKEAIEDFINRSDKITEDFSNTQLSPAPARALVQFTYGPSSLKNFDFLEYLVESKANLSSDIIKQLKEEENNYLLNLNDQSKGNLIITKRLEQYKKDLKTYKKLSEQTSVTFNDRPVILGLTDLSKRADLIASFPEEETLKEKSYLRGQYSGSLLEVIEKIASESKLKVSFKPDLKTIVFSNKFMPENINKLSADKIKDIFAVAKDGQKINEIIEKISKKNDELSEEEISNFMNRYDSESVKSFVSLLLHQINQEQIYKKKNIDLSTLRKSIISFSESAQKDTPKTIATFNPDLQNGMEKVIEKFSVYNDTPENMEKLLTSYSVFKEKCAVSKDKNGNPIRTNSPGNGLNNLPGATTNSNNKNNQGNNIVLDSSLNKTNADNNSKNLVNPNNPNQNLNNNALVSPNDNKNISGTNVSPNSKADTSKSDNETEKLITQSDPSFVSAALTGCVTINKDPTGVLVAGSVVETQLAARFINDQDKPVKQALLEIYILEVSSDWQSELKTAIAKNFKGGGALTPIGLDGTAGAVSFSTINANKFNIQALITALETNYVGRKISNPMILIKDGGTGSVKKTVTNRQILTTAGVVSSVGSTGNAQTVSELKAPLDMKITANINKHNDNIELDFDYSETQLKDDSITSSSTENVIAAKLVAQPGQIIVMAGLKKEASQKEIDGLPGTTNLGPLSTIASWFNGRQLAGNSGSELLVFIKPTVITNLNSNKIIKQVNY